MYSGHNAYGEWGPPPETARTAVVVGAFTEPDLTAWFGGCELAATYASPPGVDNEEDGALIRNLPAAAHHLGRAPAGDLRLR